MKNTPIRTVATLALCLLTLGFLALVYRACQQKPTRSAFESAHDSAAHYQEKARIADDSAAYYEIRYQQSKSELHSLAVRLFRGDATTVLLRDSLRAIVQGRVLDSLRKRPARQPAALHPAPTHSPKPPESP